MFTDMSEHNKDKLMMENEFDIGQMFRLILMQSKLILLVTIIGLILGTYLYVSSDRVYKVNSLLQAYSQQSSSITSDVFSTLSMSNSGADVQNYNQIYKSRTNILDIIINKKLNITSNLNDEQKHLIDSLEIFNVLDSEKIYINFNNQGYEIKDENDNIIASSLYGKFENEELYVNILKPEIEIDDTIEVSYFNPEKMYMSIEPLFNVRTSEQRYYLSRGSELFQVSYLTRSPERGIEVLDYANDLFIRNNIKSESEEARKALSFIELNLQKVQADLEVDKENLKNFQETNKSVNVDLEIRSIIDAIAKIETQISEIDIELAKASNSFTQTNPLYLEFIQQKEELLKQKDLIENRIKGLPIAQQQYIDLSKELEMKQEVYSQLVSKQLEFSIREASTLGNIKVIDSAYVVEMVSPRLSSIALFGIFSLFISLLGAILRGYFFLPISNPAEIADRNVEVPITGVIPKIEDLEDTKEQERYLQSLQSLIVNITNLSEKKKNSTKKIMITSPTAKNGKTFISRNLATRLSEVGNKVLIFDGDWKRGDLHIAFERKKISLDEFKKFSPENLKNFQIKENLYFLPRVSGLNDSFQYIYSDSFKKLFESDDFDFDYIIFDSAPLLSVSDTAIMMAQCDLNFCVVRHSLTKINEIKQIISMGEQIGITIDGLIYNSYQRPSSYYGYYGLYGNYSYQYYAKKYLYDAYDYEKDS